MAQLSVKSFQLLRRSYAVAADNMKVQAVASVMRNATELRAEVLAEQKETFWMRDPKTGNWIPENHFGDIDVAELREKFLSKKQK
ncbi:PREDICTED: protein SENESCENCE-ASSOCIATED GENE 21, mitochondrial isoform X2 [Theobroma cacao]|uniref:Protein SENESCENCE-ASSOCIATED GENE 21, mitochondrial isoform X2 n=1 Tax=Theobroma cacao TaxID=3641 RepID=A0AB32WJX2_THECC|nr:PREDICTED: protein SENESCENCE-ASSOCIATED GENE 21, mitochondrial isoform X2 [Theobroma cacao]